MNKSAGIAGVGALFKIISIIIILFFVSKIVPVYFEHYEIANSVESLNQIEPSSITGDLSSDVGALRSSLQKNLEINNITSVNPEQISITPEEGGRFKVVLKYKVVKPLYRNMSLLFDFDETYEVKIK
jgi:hypothetical protein